MRYEGKKDEMKWRALGVKKKHPKVVRVQNYDVSWRFNYPDTEYKKDFIYTLNIKTDGNSEEAIRIAMESNFMEYAIEMYNVRHKEKVSFKDVEIIKVVKNEFLEI